MAWDWIKKGLKGASTVFTGGFGEVGKRIVDTVAGQFPEKMSDLEKSQMEIAVMKIVNEEKDKALARWNEQEEIFYERIKAMEGTASDLLQLPVIGRIVIFLRGIQRPLWGFLVLYMDLMIFSGKWSISRIAAANPEIAPDLVSLIWLINLVVLAFLFGERAVKNVMPFFERFMAVKTGQTIDSAKG